MLNHRLHMRASSTRRILRTRSQENLALSCMAMFLLEIKVPLVPVKLPWTYRKTNPTSRMEIAKKYLTNTRLVVAGAEEVNDIICAIGYTVQQAENRVLPV